MYLIVIQVPFQNAGNRCARVAVYWAQSLLLLRDSMAGRFGRIVVAAPELPPGHRWNQQLAATLDAEHDNIAFVSLCPANLRAREFWPGAAGVYRRCLQLARGAQVVHSGTSDLYRPIAQLGFYAALRAGVPTVFVADTDAVLQLQQLEGGTRPWKTGLYCRLYQRMVRHAVAQADLSLLKGRALMERYGPYARNARDFHDTSYRLSWVITPEQVNRKVAQLRDEKELRLVTLGRLIPRKGVDESLRVVRSLLDRGIRVRLEVIGDGPERVHLQHLAEDAGLVGAVSFVGAVNYDHALIRYLQDFHLLLLTPTAEDTPRTLFDSFAAGLPFAGYDVSFAHELIDSGHCGVTAPIGDSDALAQEIARLWSDRRRLGELVRNAADLGRLNSAEEWYKRRARWTFDAVLSHSTRSRPAANLCLSESNVNGPGDI